MQKKPAVFLDRDGTLIEDRGHLRQPAEIVFYDDTVAALRLLQKQFVLFIVTHQPGIAQGLLSEAEVTAVNRAVTDHLARFGISIARVYCCPHQRSDDCECIKPKPHFLGVAARDFNLDLAHSFTIGDHPHDEALGRNAGATGIYVLTGHGHKHRQELSGSELIAAGIAEAAALAADTTQKTERM